jgi:cold shock CspA family protein
LGKSEEAKMWTNILNQYNDGVRHGKFLTDMDKIEKTLVHVKHLSQSPFLYAFVSIPQLLGYLSFMQGQKKEALEQIKHAVRIQDSPENAISLATIALDLGENELAFFTLKKLFLKINFTEEQYKIIWYKFLDLVIKIKAYNDFATIFGNKYRQLSPNEKQGVYEAVVFFLLQNRQRKDAEDLIQTALSLEPDADIRYTALDALKKWGQPDREYEQEAQAEAKTEDKTPAQPQKEKINLPENRRSRPNLLEANKPSSQYTFSSIILTLRDNYGFIKYGTNNLFFHAFDLANCQFAELSEGDQVEFKLKKGIKGSDVACEVKIMHAPKKKIEPNPATFTPKPFVPRVEAQPEKQEPIQEDIQATTETETQAQ